MLFGNISPLFSKTHSFIISFRHLFHIQLIDCVSVCLSVINGGQPQYLKNVYCESLDILFSVCVCNLRLTVSIFCVSGSNMHHTSSNSSMTAEEATRGVAVEKFDIVKKWGLNTYKVCQ